ncbi:MAG: hypothetical protein M3389_06810, partial [Actinomycetota bacterium]|nr:hypothetical protein [Actinomycetota bacterium]
MRLRLPLAAAVTAAAAFLVAPAAEAATTCARSGTTVTVEGEVEFVAVFLSGTELRAITSTGTIDCGDATDANTDDVHIVAPPDVDVLASAGLVAPLSGGATDEPGSSDEIEVAVDGYAFPAVLASGPSNLAAGARADGALLANVDAAQDDEPDLVATGPIVEMELIGSGDADVIAADGSAGTGAPPGLRVNPFGADGEDTLTGGQMQGGAGDDTLIDPTPGGEERDAIADYQQAAGPVKVVLPGGTLPGQDGDGGTDTFAGLTTIQATPFGDELTAGPDGAVFLALAGDDTLVGGPAGDVFQPDAGEDTVDGGGGDDAVLSFERDDGDVYEGGPGTLDQVRYASTTTSRGRTAPLRVTTGGGADDGEEGEGDDVRGDVEVIFGGAGADVLTGDGDAELLFGAGGADTVDGRGGDDVVDGDGGGPGIVDAGNVVVGGPGADVLVGSEGPDDLRA